jgi:hypothetical protein
MSTDEIVTSMKEVLVIHQTYATQNKLDISCLHCTFTKYSIVNNIKVSLGHCFSKKSFVGFTLPFFWWPTCKDSPPKINASFSVIRKLLWYFNCNCQVKFYNINLRMVILHSNASINTPKALVICQWICPKGNPGRVNWWINGCPCIVMLLNFMVTHTWILFFQWWGAYLSGYNHSDLYKNR